MYHFKLAKPHLPTAVQVLAALQFYEKAKHLTPEAPERVLRTLKEASRHRDARVKATDAINNAAGKQVIPPATPARKASSTTLYPPSEPERITQGPDMDAVRRGRSTYTPPGTYSVDPPRSQRTPGPSSSK